MIVRALNTTEVNAVLDATRAGRKHEPRHYEIQAGTAQRQEDVVERLVVELDALRGQFEGSDDQAALLEFDAQAAELIHKSLPLPDRLAADDDVWRYLACVEMLDGVKWRHPSQDSDGDDFPKYAHFGVGTKWECFPKRLWFRAELSMDESQDDPYILTRRGGMDFWASGMLRVLYTSNRAVTRALIRFQYPEPGEFKGNMYRPQRLTLNGVRALYKRLRHFNSIIAMATLSDEEADALIYSVAEGLPKQSRVDEAQSDEKKGTEA